MITDWIDIFKRFYYPNEVITRVYDDSGTLPICIGKIVHRNGEWNWINSRVPHQLMLQTEGYYVIPSNIK